MTKNEIFELISIIDCLSTNELKSIPYYEMKIRRARQLLETEYRQLLETEYWKEDKGGE